MTQTDVYAVLISHYPKFVSFAKLMEELTITDASARMNLQRLINGGLVCKTYANFGGRKKIVYKAIPVSESVNSYLLSDKEVVEDDTRINP